MKLNLSVSKGDIENGEKAQPNNCAIAKALKRNVAGLKEVAVFVNHAHFKVNKNKKSINYVCSMPKEASKFIRDFDRGLAVAPFKLKLNFTPLASYKSFANY